EPSISDVVLEALRQMDEKDLVDVIRVLATGRTTLDLEALSGGRFQLTEGEELIASALSSCTQQVLDALTEAERLDIDVLRVVAMALLVTTRVEEVAAQDASVADDEVVVVAE